jgi:ParB/RepB/Spo0J family partition protein
MSKNSLPKRSVLKVIPISRIDKTEHDDLIDGRLADPEGIEELSQSIRLQGLLQPIGVRTFWGPGSYALVFGRRRLAAVELLGHTHIEARILDVDPNEGELAMYAENMFTHRITSSQFSEQESEWFKCMYIKLYEQAMLQC